MACGKAILASATCGAAIDLVQNSVNGWVFESNDKKALLEKLHWMVADKNRVTEMGNQSKRIIKDWGYENGAAAIEAIFTNYKQLQTIR